MVEVLVDDLPRLRGNLDAAVQSGDADSLRRAAHSLKGSLRFLGDIPSFQIAQTVETKATDKDLANLNALIETLNRELDTLTPSLKQYIQ